MKIKIYTPEFGKVYNLICSTAREEMISDFLYDTNRNRDREDCIDEDSLEIEETLATIILQKFEERCVASHKISKVESEVKDKEVITFEDYCTRIGLTINDVVETIAYLTDDDFDPDYRASIPCDTFALFMSLSIEKGFHAWEKELSLTDEELSYGYYRCGRD